MKIVVIDGQGGGVGRALVERISTRCPEAELIAVGTNSMATANMLKGGKISGATGENAAVYNSKTADIIIGPMGIIRANAMFGEITPAIAEAVAGCEGEILLIPMNKCGMHIIGVQEKKITEYIEEAVEKILEYMEMTLDR